MMSLEDKIAEPIKWLSIGQFIAVDNEIFKIKNLDTLLVTRTFANIAANTDISASSVPEVDPEERVLYAFLIGIQGRVNISINQPASTQRWGARVAPRGFISYIESPMHSPHPQTFTVTLKNRTIDMTVRNLLPSVQTARVRFQGYKYELQRVTGDAEEKLRSLLQAGRLPEVLTRGMALSRG